MRIKNILATTALIAGLATTAQAGAIIDIEIGGGSWSTSAPTGSLTTAGTVGDATFDFQNQANLGETTDNAYMWAVLDHPIPIVPNIRIEQVTLKSAGTKNVNIANLINGNIETELDMSNTDMIAYWGVPFATWLPFMDEVDFGLGVKSFSGALIMDNGTPADTVNTSFDGAMVPYGYAKLRVVPPFMMGIGLEVELKQMAVEDVATFDETIVKADWGFLAPLPLLDIEGGIEVGYRSMNLEVDVPELNANFGFDGIFFGVYGKFGI